MHGLSLHRKKKKRFSGIFVGIIFILIIGIGGIIWIGARDTIGIAQTFSTLSTTIQSIKSDVEHYRYSRIQQSLTIAQGALSELKSRLATAPTFSFSYSPFKAYRQESLTLVSLSELLVNIVQNLSEMVIPIEKILLVHEGEAHLKNLTEQDKKQIFDTLTTSLPSVMGSRASLDLIIQRLENMPDAVLPSQALPLKRQLYEYAKKLSDLIDVSLPFISVVPGFLGHGHEMTYLLLLQNNAEVRGTGGFIGTYGILTLRNGEIKTFFTDNIYNFDDKAKHLRIPPPIPLKKYAKIPAWYLRDSNWSPDFPTAARQALWFYAREGGTQKIDGVIALTPEVIASLMRIVGPVSVENLHFDPDQFYDQLQYQVEKGYERRGISRSERKDVVRMIADEIIVRIGRLSIPEWEGILGVMRARLAEKTLMIYARDTDLFQFIRDNGWSGEVRRVSGDYLMVVDSNMISLKTDAVMDKHISYSLNEHDDDSLYAKVVLTYTHNGTFSWTSTRYRDYVRILIPQGSVIQSSSIPLEVSLEHGKMVLGGFIQIDPQKIGTLSVEYKLPKRIQQDVKNGLYTLFVQKQSGVNQQKLLVSTDFKSPITSYKPYIGSTSKLQLGAIEFSSLLQTDKEFAVAFK